MSERWNFTLMIFKKSFNALNPFSDAAAVKKRKAKKNYYRAHKIYQVFSSVRLLLASCGSAKNEVRIENRKRENYNVFSSCLRQTILNFHFCILLFSLVHQHLLAVFSVHFRWEAEKRKKKRIKSSKKSCWKLNAATKEYKKVFKIRAGDLKIVYCFRSRARAPLLLYNFGEWRTQERNRKKWMMEST